MSLPDASSFLRRALVVDAVVSGATGLLMAAGAGTLQEVLGIPTALLRYVGLSLIPFAAFLVLLSRRPRLTRGIVLAVIVGNAAWVAASVLLLTSGRIEPTALGHAFVVVQAVAVAGLAEMEYVGLRKAAATA
jgi:hypothetical protein